MKIAIIGDGIVGSALARGFGQTGHEVILGSRRPEDEEVRALAEAVVHGLAVTEG